MSDYRGEHHPIFQASLVRSYPSVCAVADHLRWMGWTVIAPRPEVAPTYEERALYSDRGDIFVLRHVGQHIEVTTIEVRQILHETQFSFPDQPWPLRRWFVCGVKEWERFQREGRVPEAFIRTNRVMDSAGFVLPGQSALFLGNIQEVLNPLTKQMEECYWIATEHVRFFKLQKVEDRRR